MHPKSISFFQAYFRKQSMIIALISEARIAFLPANKTRTGESTNYREKGSQGPWQGCIVPTEILGNNGGWGAGPCPGRYLFRTKSGLNTGPDWGFPDSRILFQWKRC